ncbi:MAG: hypothetical protein V5A63_19525 [Bacteroides sp.]|uniref:hypothetical protein n=1 Tax=Bacteroides sp. TaxID=29523 RepID=UPI002FC28E63
MKKLAVIILILLFISPTLTANLVEIDVNSLDLEAYKEEWEENDKISFEFEGINITVENKFLDIVMTFRETMGRDAKLNFMVPEDYMKPSVLGNIKTESNKTITWESVRNTTVVSFKIYAYEEVVLKVSKTDITLGKAKKKVHDFFNYVEYNADSNGTQKQISILVDKDNTNFEVDNEHMIVQYETASDILGNWYYPVEDTSSSDVYYHVTDLGDRYKVTVDFNKNKSGDIKLHTFPGASEGFFNKEGITGAISHFWLKTTTGAKKMLVDFFGTSEPRGE